jgi:polyisoprenyl-phosphate glycosyltransferase
MTEHPIQPALRSLRISAPPTYSVVVPAYRESGNLDRLYAELVASLDALDGTWEIILVDDGSPDDTWRVITKIHELDPRVSGLRLSRNFGHQYALIAGLAAARGDAMITMDGDLQHPPSTISSLVAEWRRGSKIVHTVRKDLASVPWTKRFTSKLFYRVFSFLSGVPLSPGMADFRLLDRQVVTEILKLKESGLFLRGLVQWVGYPSSQVEYECANRFAGTTSYSFRRMVRFAWTGITSFSVVPLRLAIVLGLATSLFAFYELFEALYTKMFTNEALRGWTSLFVLTALLFGILFILLGIIGEYIARILEEVRGRPRYIVSEIVGDDTPPTAASGGVAYAATQGRTATSRP